jgi:hypothetical protein
MIQASGYSAASFIRSARSLMMIVFVCLTALVGTVAIRRIRLFYLC